MSQLADCAHGLLGCASRNGCQKAVRAKIDTAMALKQIENPVEHHPDAVDEMPVELRSF